MYDVQIFLLVLVHVHARTHAYTHVRVSFPRYRGLSEEASAARKRRLSHFAPVWGRQGVGSGVGGDYSVHVDYESEYEEGEGAEDDVSEEHAKVLLSMYPNTVVCKREEGG